MASRRYTRTASSGRKGSDTSRGNYPRDCHLCGERVVVSGPNMRACDFRVTDGVATAAHIDCLQKAREDA